MPGLYISCMGDCQERLLINFGKSKIAFICTILGLILHLFNSFLFISYLDLGIYGTGYAVFTTQVFTFLLMIYFTYTDPILR